MPFLPMLAVTTAVLSMPASAASFVVSTTGGLMQQANGHYYHAIYGATVDVGTNTGNILGRGSWLERPEFTAAGFADKEQAGFALVGTKVSGRGTAGGLYAFFGGGAMSGYVRAIDPSIEASSRETIRRYRVNGITAAVEYAANWHSLSMALGHQTFIGLVDRTQLDAYVAWPYNFYQVRLGYAL